MYSSPGDRCGPLLVVLLLPAAAFAQAAITGVVKDASGAVLPGVTVEAASPVLIEKVRSVVSDDTGQYRIVDLRPGTYVVTFTLPGFSTVKREGIELSGDFVATVNGDLQGRQPRRDDHRDRRIADRGRPERPRPDHRGPRRPDRDPFVARRHRHSVAGSRDEQQRRLRRHHWRQRRDGRLHPRRPRLRLAERSTTASTPDGPARTRTPRSRTWPGSQEVVLTTSGGLGEAETGGVDAQRHSPRWRQQLQRHLLHVGRERRHAGQQLHRRRSRTAGLRSPQELRKVFEFNPMGGGRIIRDKLWFYATYREVSAENTVPGMFFNRNAGDPTKWLVDFDTTRPRSTTTSTRNAIGRLTWQVSPRNKISLSHSEQYGRRNQTAAARPNANARSAGYEALHARPHSDGHLGVALHEPPAASRPAGPTTSPYANFGAACRRLAQRLR